MSLWIYEISPGLMASKKDNLLAINRVEVSCGRPRGQGQTAVVVAATAAQTSHHL